MTAETLGGDQGLLFESDAELEEQQSPPREIDRSRVTCNPFGILITLVFVFVVLVVLGWLAIVIYWIAKKKTFQEKQYINESFRK